VVLREWLVLLEWSRTSFRSGPADDHEDIWQLNEPFLTLPFFPRPERADGIRLEESSL
jgi:hypothetical protein